MNQNQNSQNRTDQNASKAIEKLTLYLQIATLLLGFIITILGYIYIERFKAQESQANTELIKSNTELAQITKSLDQIELDLKNVKEDLNILQQKTRIIFDLMQLVTEIRPNFRLEIEKWNLSEDSLTLQLLYQITNEGKHSVLVRKELHNIFFTTSNEKLLDPNNQNFLLKPEEDFIFTHHSVSNLGPNENLKGEIIFSFKSPLKIPIDLTATFIVELDPTIVMILQNNAKDLLGDQDVLNKLTQITHTECFTLIKLKDKGGVSGE